MGQIVYQRPREKLEERGAGVLSVTELIQILIGSGSRNLSAARIAQMAGRLFGDPPALSYANLIQIPGMGKARACQILAAIELGSRVHTHPVISSVPNHGFNKIKEAPKRMLEYTTYGDSGKMITKQAVYLSDVRENKAAIKSIFTQALRDRAASLVVGIGYRLEPLDTLDETILPLLKTLFETSNLLEIKLPSIWVVNQLSQKEFRRKVLL